MGGILNRDERMKKADACVGFEGSERAECGAIYQSPPPPP